MMWRNHQRFVDSVRRGMEDWREKDALIKECEWVRQRETPSGTLYAIRCCNGLMRAHGDTLCPRCRKPISFKSEAAR